jgi:hypothetical protein
MYVFRTGDVHELEWGCVYIWCAIVVNHVTDCDADIAPVVPAGSLFRRCLVYGNRWHAVGVTSSYVVSLNEYD